MDITFYKYHGTGNDFILIDLMDGKSLNWSEEKIARLCHRRFGIGADGLMFLKPHPIHDFEMVYYNADGNVSSMCGNGGRCIVKFAYDLGYITKKTTFIAIDGLHTAEVKGDEISLGMIDVIDISKTEEGDYVLNTGSPHYVHFGNESDLQSIVTYGKKIRYNKTFEEEGINVNIVAVEEGHLKIATYERGVENETFSCGTGVVAGALSYAYINGIKNTLDIKTKGGELSVSYVRDDQGFTNIDLIGPAKYVFKGKIIQENG